MRALLFLLCLAATMAPCHATIILLHGSFAVDSLWYQPGVFHSNVFESARHQQRELSSFSWSGKFTPEAIITDAENLVHHLLTLPAKEPITLIAHSNGGNVCAYATILLAELTQSVLLSKKRTAKTRTLHLAQRLYSFAQELATKNTNEKTAFLCPEIQNQITTLYTQLYQNVLHDLQRRLSKVTFFINDLFLLGTPINTDTFVPDMSVVEHVYNLYSEADPIQAIAEVATFLIMSAALTSKSIFIR